MNNLFYTVPKYLQNLKGISSSASEIDGKISLFFQSPFVNAFEWTSMTMTTNVYVNSVGSINTISGYGMTDYIPITPNKLYAVSLKPSSQTEIGAFYSSDNTWIGRMSKGGITPALATKARVNVDNSYLNKTMLMIEDDTKYKKIKKIAFLGDSITAGYSPSSVLQTSEIYHQVLKEMLGLDSCLNFGISSTHLAGGYTGSPGTSQSGAVRFYDIPYDVDAVVVFMGINDFIHTATAPIGSLSDRTNNSFYGGCHVLFGGLQEKFISKPIYVVTPMKYYLEDTPNPTTGLKLSEYVDIIIEVATFYGIPIIDAYRQLNLDSRINAISSTFFYDGLHPNKYGHQKLANLISKYI